MREKKKNIQLYIVEISKHVYGETEAAGDGKNDGVCKIRDLLI